MPAPPPTRRIRERRGVASFELVMSFPILMFLVAMLYTIYMATMMKSQLTMEVRHNAWLERSTPWKARNQQPFGVLAAHQSGESRRELSRSVAVYRNWYPGVPRRITWGNVVLSGSWDYRQVRFQRGLLPIYPHLGVLTQMATAQGGVQTTPASVGSLNSLANIPGL